MAGGADRWTTPSAGRRMGIEQSKEPSGDKRCTRGAPWTGRALGNLAHCTEPLPLSGLWEPASLEGVQWAEPLCRPFGSAYPLHPEMPSGHGAGQAWVASLLSQSAPSTSIQVSRCQGWVGTLGRGGLEVLLPPPTISPHGSFSGKRAWSQTAWVQILALSLASCG